MPKMKRPRSLVLTVRIATSMENANVPGLLERAAGDDARAELVTSEMVRTDVDNALEKRGRARKEDRPGPKVVKTSPRKRAERRAAG